MDSKRIENAFIEVVEALGDVEYKEELKDEGNCVFIGGKTFVVTYQEKDFYSNDSHNLGLYLKDENFRNEYIQLYLVTCVKKSLGHQYSWGNSISKAKIKNDNISLPINNYFLLLRPEK